LKMISLWLPRYLIEVLDEIVKVKNEKYGSRSDLIRIAIVHYLTCEKGENLSPEMLLGKKPLEIKKPVIVETQHTL